MKKIFILFSALFFSITLCKAQAWLWNDECNANLGLDPYATAVDKYGDVYIIGSFRETMHFGKDSIFFTGNLCVNHISAYLAKYKSDGSLIWAKQISQLKTNVNSGCTPEGITLDDNGNIYIAGQYTDTVTIGDSMLIAKESSTRLYTCAFVAKFDSSGKALWVSHSHAPGTAYSWTSAYSVTLDNMGNTYIVGEFTGMVFFGKDSISSGTASDLAFITKYNSLGNLIWIKQTQTTNSNSQIFTTSCTCSKKGSECIYLSGSFQISAVLGHDTLSAEPGSYPIYIALFDTSGNFKWARQTTTSATSGYQWGWVNGMTCDTDGSAYLTGDFEDTISFSSDQFISQYGNQSFFMAKYDTGGNMNWAKCATGSGSTSGISVSSDAHGNIYIGGWEARDTMAFGTFRDTINADSGSMSKAFILDIDKFGNVICASTLWGADLPFIGSDSSGKYVCAQLSNEGGLGVCRWATCAVIDGLNNIPQKSGQLSVYPNPSSGIFNYELPITSYGACNVEVYNTLGQLVYAKPIVHNSSFIVNLTGQPTGIYMYRVTDLDGKCLGSGKLEVAK